MTEDKHPVVRGHSLRELSEADLSALYQQLSAELPLEDQNPTYATLRTELDLVEVELWSRP